MAADGTSALDLSTASTEAVGRYSGHYTGCRDAPQEEERASGLDPLPFHLAILEREGIPHAALRAAQEVARKTGETAHGVLLTRGLTSARGYTRRLGAALGMAVAEGRELALDRARLSEWIRRGGAPVHFAPLSGGAFAIAPLGRGLAGLVALAGASRGTGPRIVLTTPHALSEAVLRDCREDVLDWARHGIDRLRPGFSAEAGITGVQRIVFAVALAYWIAALVTAPAAAWIALSALFAVFFLGQTLIRVGAFLHVFAPPRTIAPARLPDRKLPHYSVLIPLYREARLVPDLRQVVASFDYPAAKLDIKLVLEEDDTATIAAVRAAAFPENVEVILAPASLPRTKPKALNVAVPFARGDLIAIFDAEDRPAPDQLRRAAETFAAAPPDTAVLQARLGYYNAEENWLSAQFAIEYAALFGLTLPALERLDLPIPLGGTSNHFRADVLRAAGGWDAWNVTEDADLGMRILRLGWRCRLLDSDTVEEAACRWGVWMRQRTRWLKGWMQTYLVHMRDPLRLLRELGAWRFFGFQAVVGGMIVAPVAHFYFLAAFGFLLATGQAFAAPHSPAMAAFLVIAALNLFLGYLGAWALGFLALSRTGARLGAHQVALVPLYWLLIGIAAHRALWQLFVAPHLWEKTPHGLSRLRWRWLRDAAG